MTDSLNGWAPIVHGRTYRVDFRPHLLVVPDWFCDTDIAFVRNYIRTSTRSAEQLPNRPRWLFLRTDRFQLAGTTCMASFVSSDMTHDRPDPGSGGTGRPLYVFLGWATRDLAADPPPMNIDYYKELYQFVRNRWNNAPPDDVTDIVGTMVERFPPLSQESQIVELLPDRSAFDSENLSCRVWQDSLRTTLWASAGRITLPTSLCVGMARPRDVEDSPMCNITVAGSDECITLNRIPKPAAGATGRNVNTGSYEPRSSMNEEFYSRQRAGFPPTDSPRRHKVNPGVIDVIVNALYSLLRTLCSFGRGSSTKQNVDQDSSPPPVSPVGMGDILRPVRPKTRNPKGDAFDAFDESDDCRGEPQ